MSTLGTQELSQPSPQSQASGQGTTGLQRMVKRSETLLSLPVGLPSPGALLYLVFLAGFL